MLIIGISIASFVFGNDAVQGHVVTQIQGLVGRDAALMIQSMIENAHRSSSGFTATLFGIATLLIGATAVFGELQDAFNLIWRSKPQPRSFWLAMMISRLLSFSLVIALGFLMLASLIASAGITGLYRISREARRRHRPDFVIDEFRYLFCPAHAAVCFVV